MTGPATTGPRATGAAFRPTLPGWARHPAWANRIGMHAAVDAVVLALAGLLTAIRFLRLHVRMAPDGSPSFAAMRGARPPWPGAQGWWNWWDQGWYVAAAKAWAHGVLDPSLHWYLPGYPLLGAAFGGMTPADPFLLPNLFCLLGALWICAGLGRRLLDAGRWSVPLACAAFLGCTVWSDTVLGDWVLPWSTTPEAVAFLGALLAVAGLSGSARPLRRAAFAGVAAGMVAGCRPADGAVILGVALLGAVVLAGRGRRGPAAAALLAGLAVPLLVVGGAYVAVWGFRASPYVASAQRVGFGFALLPSRWMSLMVDPGPLLPGGRGLAEAFPFVAAGVAGMVAALIRPGRAGRRVHAVMLLAFAADLVLFLCYRDLHPTGLWRFRLNHYFVALLPLSALYAMRLVVMVPLAWRSVRDGAAIAAGLFAAATLFCWHVELVPLRRLAWDGPDTVVVPDGLQPLDAVVLVPARGRNDTLVATGEGRLADGRAFSLGSDAVAYDAGDALRLQPLRRLPAEQTTFRFDRDVVLDHGAAPMLMRRRFRPGLPPGWWHRLGPPAE